MQALPAHKYKQAPLAALAALPPLTRKRMQTIDDEIVSGAEDYIRRQAKGDSALLLLGPNTTHMHFRTHPKPKSVGQVGESQSTYHDTMIDHDRHVGRLLDLLDELDLAEDTFVMYSTDNGPRMNSLAGRGHDAVSQRKGHELGGAFRIPLLVRWPGRIPAGVVSNDIVQHHDWLPTFLAMAGEPEIIEQYRRAATQQPASQRRLHRRTGACQAQRRRRVLRSRSAVERSAPAFALQASQLGDLPRGSIATSTPVLEHHMMEDGGHGVQAGEPHDGVAQELVHFTPVRPDQRRGILR